MFVLIFLGKDLKLTNCLYVNITKIGMHFPQKTKFTLLHQTGYLYLQNLQNILFPKWCQIAL